MYDSEFKKHGAKNFSKENALSNTPFSGHKKGGDPVGWDTTVKREGGINAGPRSLSQRQVNTEE